MTKADKLKHLYEVRAELDEVAKTLDPEKKLTIAVLLNARDNALIQINELLNAQG